MPTRPPRPRSGDDAERGVALADIPLLDADGIEIPLVGARIEQIAVNEAHGALAFRLHRRGDVIGRSAHLVYVRFEGEYHHSELRPNLVRLVSTLDPFGSPAGPGQRAMTGRHRRRARRPHGAEEMVDASSGIAHLLPSPVQGAGGHLLALCGVLLLPTNRRVRASRYCPPCQAVQPQP